MTSQSRMMFIGFVVAIMTSACGAARIDLVKTSVVTVVTIPSDTKAFSVVHAEQEGDELLVFGRLKKEQGAHPSSGQVDAAIVTQDGKVLSAFCMPIRKVGKKRPGWVGAHFRARLPVVVSKGTSVRLAYHPCACQSNCSSDENYALRR